MSGSYTYFADGDVLLAKITPCFENGKLGVARGLTNGVGFGSSEYIVLRPAPTLNAEFLYYYLARPTFLEEGARTMTGAVGHKRVTKEFVEGYSIPLPPLTEQRRIVAILDEAFEGIATAKANAEKNLQNAHALFNGFMRKALDDCEGSEDEKALEQLCLIGDGNHSSNYPTKNELVEEGVPFIRATNLVAGRISGSDMRYLSPLKHAQLKKGHLKTGDILITNRGEIGKTALIDEAYDGANLNSQIAWLRCRDMMHTKFLFHVLNSEKIQNHFQSSKSGTALQQFTIKQLKALRIPHPTIALQVSLAERLDEFAEGSRTLEDVYSRKLSALDELRKSLLHRAFTGAL